MKYVQIAHDYCGLYGVICASLLSPLAMAEWIEIGNSIRNFLTRRVSPLAMAEWIEILDPVNMLRVVKVSASDGGVD